MTEVARELLQVGPVARSVARASAVSPLQPGVITTEVVVIGTGAGGAIAGTELAKAGKKVLFLEAGGAYEARDFRKRSLAWSTTHLYNGRGAQATNTTAPMVIASGRTVGGSTVLNSAICFRPPEKRLNEWVARSGAAFWEPAAFKPFVDEIWTRLGVMATHAGIGRRNNQVFLDGMRAIGLDAQFMDRSAPGCLGCGVCHLGCPSGGKASVDKSILPEALNHGATIGTRARAQHLIVEGGVVKGVSGVVVDEVSELAVGDFTVKAEIVIIAGSALGSPLLLLNSNLGGSEVGKHLSVHPGLPVFGEFTEPVVMWDGVPQGAYAHCPDDDEALLEVANVGPGELFALFGRAGDLSSIQRLANLAMAGAMIRDDGAGTVAVDDGDPEHLRPKLGLTLSARDLERMRTGARHLVRGYFKAGATRVIPGVNVSAKAGGDGGIRFCSSEAEAIDVVAQLTEPDHLAQPYASHPHGSCRMGPKDGPHKGVVGSDGAVHGVTGLYVMDGSVFPTTLGVNPQITIMATSLALSRRLASA